MAKKEAPPKDEKTLEERVALLEKQVANLQEKTGFRHTVEE